MGCSSDTQYEPPKEFQINDYLKRKEKIITNHITNSSKPTSSEIKLVSKYDIDIFEFLTRNINQTQNVLKKAKKESVKKKNEKKLQYFLDLKETFERLNWQWDELLGYNEQEQKYIQENKKFIKENIENNNLRKGIVYIEEEEEEEEESDSNDYYCNAKFYEKNPKKVGENNDIFKSYVESVKDDDENKEIVIPYGM
jgi:hypothetical protein